MTLNTQILQFHLDQTLEMCWSTAEVRCQFVR